MAMTAARERRILTRFRTHSRNQGFTLLELAIVAAIVAIGIALAVPTYERTMQKRELTNAAEGIAAFFALAQGEAVKRNETIAVTVTRNGSGDAWCVGAMIRTAATDHCDCESTNPADADYCDFNPTGAGAAQVFNSAGFEKFTMSSARAGASVSNDFSFNFDPIRGTKALDSGLIDGNTHETTLISKNSRYSLTVGLSVTGRVRICNPDTAKKVPGFNSCAIVVAPPPPPPPPPPPAT